MSDGSLSGEVFLADALENGAGYATHLGQDIVPLLDRAESLAKELEQHQNAGSTCDSSCYDCLRDYSNSTYHPLLDWRLGVDLLRLLRGRDLDLEPARALGARLADQFQQDFDWQRRDVAAVPVLFEHGTALLVSHPLENPDAGASTLTDALEGLVREGYSRQDAPGATKRLAVVSTFELVRRPGLVYARWAS